MAEQKDVELTSSHKYIKKYTNTWNNSYRKPTELWQNISDTQRCKNDLHITGQDEREGNPGGTYPTGRELGRKKDSAPQEALSQVGRSAKTDSFRGSEDSTAASLWQKRETCIDAPCYCPEFPSLRCTSPSAYTEANACYKREAHRLTGVEGGVGPPQEPHSLCAHHG